MTLQMLVRVYTCQNVKLLEISCHGSLLITIRESENCLEIKQNIYKKQIMQENNELISGWLWNIAPYESEMEIKFCY